MHRKMRASKADLYAMSDHILRDIGLHRENIPDTVRDMALRHRFPR
jgi:uncharacterized protein YjiS (DUF1127 family)